MEQIQKILNVQHGRHRLLFIVVALRGGVLGNVY